jgi:hypothetical protein
MDAALEPDGGAEQTRDDQPEKNVQDFRAHALSLRLPTLTDKASTLKEARKHCFSA